MEDWVVYRSLVSVTLSADENLAPVVEQMVLIGQGPLSSRAMMMQNSRNI
jgi:hypothetical protein